MAHERYRRRALLLGLPYKVMTRPHRQLLDRVNRRIRGHGFAWTLPDPPLRPLRTPP